MTTSRRMTLGGSNSRGAGGGSSSSTSKRPAGWRHLGRHQARRAWCGGHQDGAAASFVRAGKAEIKGAELFPQWVEGSGWRVGATAKNCPGAMELGYDGAGMAA